MAKREKKKTLRKKKKDSIVLEKCIESIDSLLSTKSSKELTNSKKNDFIKKFSKK